MRLPDGDTGVVATVHPNGAALQISIQNTSGQWRRIAYIGIRCYATQNVYLEIHENATAQPTGYDSADRHNLAGPGVLADNFTLASGITVASVTTAGFHINMMRDPRKIVWWPPNYYIHMTFPSVTSGGASEYYRLMWWQIPNSNRPEWLNDLSAVD